MIRAVLELIWKAKSVAAGRGKSVSQTIADYSASLDKPPALERQGRPLLSGSLKGALRGADAEVEDYLRHL